VRIAIIFSGAFMLAHSSFGYAGRYNPAEHDQAIRARVGIESYSETYTEYDTTRGNAKFMQQSALMRGINSSVEFELSPVHVAFVTARYATGLSDYIGGYQNAAGTYSGFGTLRSYGTPRSTYELGIGFAVFEPFTVGIGVNQRVLEDHSEFTAGGYFRKNTILYDYAFIKYSIQLDSVMVTPKATYKHLIGGKQYSGPSFGMTQGTTNTQNSGSGYNFEVSFIFPAGNRTVELTPFYRFMEIQDSDWVSTNTATGMGVIEPKNRTVEIGFSAQLLF
jgi:hypothetical protein